MITIWWLQFIGLILGFIGTILMIWGGLGGFLRVYNINDESNRNEPSVRFGVGDDTDNGWTAEFKTPKHPIWRVRCNNAGIALLGIGFLFQLAACF